MNIVAIVPARSGSKGVVNKNIQEINGKTLIQYAVDYALDTSWISEVYISTDSTDYEIRAKSYGAKSLGLRDSVLSGSNALTRDVCVDFLHEYQKVNKKEIDVLVLLQPTSPIRPSLSPELLDDFCNDRDLHTIVTISKIVEPHPMKVFVEHENGIQPLFDYKSLGTPRQKLPNTYSLTGSLYVWKAPKFIECGTNFPPNIKYVIQELFVNIDTDDDLQKAQELFS